MAALTHPASGLRYQVPVPYMAPGLMRYLDSGVPPGSFLTALLSGDLKLARRKADDCNTLAFAEWVAFLPKLPNGSHGSPAKVDAWIARFAAARAAQLASPTHSDAVRDLALGVGA